MKKITFIAIMLVLGCLAAHGQSYQNAITGQFKIAPTANGQNGYFFVGRNNTSFVLRITGVAKNMTLNQQNAMTVTLQPGQFFLHGPNENWLWQAGEYYTVIYPDGSQQTWLFNPPSDFPSFTGNTGGPCKFRNDRVGCKCYKYVPRGGRWGNVCVCNHSHGAHDAR